MNFEEELISLEELKENQYKEIVHQLVCAADIIFMYMKNYSKFETLINFDHFCSSYVECFNLFHKKNHPTLRIFNCHPNHINHECSKYSDLNIQQLTLDLLNCQGTVINSMIHSINVLKGLEDFKLNIS